MQPDDWPAVRAIYEAGIATGDATFETAVPGWEAWDAAHLAGHRLVARVDGRLAGWTALAPVSDRCAYGAWPRISIYVAPGAQGLGVGRAMLSAVVASAERGGIWTVQTGIFPENQASVRLHQRLRLPGGRRPGAPGPPARPLAGRAAAGTPQPASSADRPAAATY